MAVTSLGSCDRARGLAQFGKKTEASLAGAKCLLAPFNSRQVIAKFILPPSIAQCRAQAADQRDRTKGTLQQRHIPQRLEKSQAIPAGARGCPARSHNQQRKVRPARLILELPRQGLDGGGYQRLVPDQCRARAVPHHAAKLFHGRTDGGCKSGRLQFALDQNSVPPVRRQNQNPHPFRWTTSLEHPALPTFFPCLHTRAHR